MPRTRFGKATLVLLAAAVALFLFQLLLVAAGQRGGDTFSSNLVISIPALLAGACAIAMLVTGLIGIIAARERSVWVVVATMIGLIVAVFVIGEALGPH